MHIKDYLADSIIITDGAMGTYYAEITGRDISHAEEANLKKPSIIRDIHTSYIEAGADLIRTNTFSLPGFQKEDDFSRVRDILSAGLEIAQSAAHKKDVFVAADIGPLGPLNRQTEDSQNGEHTEIIKRYKFIVDAFYEAGADIFLFETFSSLDYLEEIINYLAGKEGSDKFILTQFALDQNGFTRKGISAQEIINRAAAIKEIDACGFNCGVGPGHLLNIMQDLHFMEDSFISALPNAGYPEVVDQRTVFTSNADYFAGIMGDIKNLGINIIGGCCGTTPLHIEKIAQKLTGKPRVKSKRRPAEKAPQSKKTAGDNKFRQKLAQDQTVIAVELDPPFADRDDDLMQKARLLAEDKHIDIITIPDSPLGRVRLEPIMTAARISRQLGIETLPHLTCRDRNSIALKSQLMTGNLEGLRNILLVTGDPVPGTTEREASGVFSLNSLQLMELVSEMNQELLAEKQYYIGGALNVNAQNLSAEIKRMWQKIESGAQFFMTQPVFSDRVVNFFKRNFWPEETKILAGILPPVSYKNARFLDAEIPGIEIPEQIINRFQKNMSKTESAEIGVQIALSLTRKLKNNVDGFYFMPPFNRVEMIIEIMHRLEMG